MFVKFFITLLFESDLRFSIIRSVSPHQTAPEGIFDLPNLGIHPGIVEGARREIRPPINDPGIEDSKQRFSYRATNRSSTITPRWKVPARPRIHGSRNPRRRQMGYSTPQTSGSRIQGSRIPVSKGPLDPSQEDPGIQGS